MNMNVDPATLDDSHASATKIGAETTGSSQQPEAPIPARVSANDTPALERADSANSKNTQKASPQSTKRLVIRHDYHDYAQFGPETVAKLLTTNNASSPVSPGEKRTRQQHQQIQQRIAAGAAASTFTATLYQMLHSADQLGYTDVVSWQPHGRAFLVHQKDIFVKDVLPRFFRQTRWASFLRQLSLYGFLRCKRSSSRDRGCYYHELFLRGRPWLLAAIPRISIKGQGGVRPSLDDLSEPNFYAMPWVTTTPGSSGNHSERPRSMGANISTQQPSGRATTTTQAAASPAAAALELPSTLVLPSSAPAATTVATTMPYPMTQQNPMQHELGRLDTASALAAILRSSRHTFSTPSDAAAKSPQSSLTGCDDQASVVNDEPNMLYSNLQAPAAPQAVCWQPPASKTNDDVAVLLYATQWQQQSALRPTTAANNEMQDSTKASASMLPQTASLSFPTMGSAMAKSAQLDGGLVITANSSPETISKATVPLSTQVLPQLFDGSAVNRRTAPELAALKTSHAEKMMTRPGLAMGCASVPAPRETLFASSISVNAAPAAAGREEETSLGAFLLDVEFSDDEDADEDDDDARDILNMLRSMPTQRQSPGAWSL